jgi:hypothetical protein
MWFDLAWTDAAYNKAQLRAPIVGAILVIA